MKGSKGELSRVLQRAQSVSKWSTDECAHRDSDPDDARESKALHGLSRALLNNMVVGVSEGFKKDLEIQGVGYRAAMKGSDIELQVGYSHPVLVRGARRASRSMFPSPRRSASPASTRKR